MPMMRDVMLYHCMKFEVYKPHQ